MSVALGVAAHTVILSGVAGLVAGAFSMALGEYTSVATQNEQLDAEVRVEKRAMRKYPKAELAELVDMFADMGMSEVTAAKAATEVHSDPERALNVHVTHGAQPVGEAVAACGRRIGIRDVRRRRRVPADSLLARIRFARSGPDWAVSAC